jgi:hypothetical protein
MHVVNERVLNELALGDANVGQTSILTPGINLGGTPDATRSQTNEYQ